MSECRRTNITHSPARVAFDSLSQAQLAFANVVAQALARQWTNASPPGTAVGVTQEHRGSNPESKKSGIPSKGRAGDVRQTQS